MESEALLVGLGTLGVGAYMFKEEILTTKKLKRRGLMIAFYGGIGYILVKLALPSGSNQSSVGVF